MARAHFITFEGGEGVGKSTQASLLVERLRAAGRPAIATREPGGSAAAEAIRHLLLSGATDDLGAAGQALLVSAARHDHIETTIRPALDAGTSVVCDRFIDSTRVYQGTIGALDRRWVTRLERLTVGRTRPDLTLILDLPAAAALARVQSRAAGERSREATRGQADRFERGSLAFHESIRAGFLDIAARDPARCATIDASAPVATVAETLWAEVCARLFDGVAGQPS